MAKFTQVVDVLDLSVEMFRFVATDGTTLDVNVSGKVPFARRAVTAMETAKAQGFDWVEFGKVDRVLPFIKR